MAILLQCPCETLQKQLCSTIYSLHLKNQTLKCIATAFHRSNVYSTSNLRKGKSRNSRGSCYFFLSCDWTYYQDSWFIKSLFNFLILITWLVVTCTYKCTDFSNLPAILLLHFIVNCSLQHPIINFPLKWLWIKGLSITQDELLILPLLKQDGIYTDLCLSSIPFLSYINFTPHHMTAPYWIRLEFALPHKQSNKCQL